MSVQNFSFLARLEVAEKFVVGWCAGPGQVQGSALVKLNNIEPNIKPNNEPNIESNIEPNEPIIKLTIKLNIEPNILRPTKFTYRGRMCRYKQFL